MHLNSSIWPIFYLTLSGATTTGQGGPESNVNEGVLRISQTPALLEPHYQIVSRHIRTLVANSSAEMQLVYSTAPVDWAETTRNSGLFDDCDFVDWNLK